MRIDGKKLRRLRLAHGLSQTALGSAAGFTGRYYVDLIERRRSPAKEETIRAFARALGVGVEEIIADDPPISRRTMVATSLAAVSVVGAALTGSSPDTTTDRSAAQPLCVQRPSIEQLWVDVEALVAQGLREQAEQYAQEVRARYPEGSDDWATITVEILAPIAQQGSHIRGVREYRCEVKDKYLSVVPHPSPRVQAWVLIAEAWMLAEQCGSFRRSHERITQARPYAQELCGPYGDHLWGFCHHLRLRTAVERALQDGENDFGLLPSRRLPTADLVTVQKALVCDASEEEAVIQRYAIESPHSDKWKLLAASILRPRETEAEIKRFTARYRSRTDAEVISLLLDAQFDVSQSNWANAAAKAVRAYREYARIKFPTGMAMAKAIEADSLYARGKTQDLDEVEKCVDAWAHVLLLHPFDLHPVFYTARSRLDELIGDVTRREPTWYADYLADLDDRVLGQETEFTLLRGVTSAASHAVDLPSSFLRRYVPPKLTDDGA